MRLQWHIHIPKGTLPRKKNQKGLKSPSFLTTSKISTVNWIQSILWIPVNLSVFGQMGLVYPAYHNTLG